MPLSKYNSAFGGKPGAATEAHNSMMKQYGAKKGEQVFYATKNKRMKSNMPKGGSMTVKGDIGAMRQAESDKVGGFKDGPAVKTEGKFGSHSSYKREK